jgi:hypothetical protein
MTEDRRKGRRAGKHVEEQMKSLLGDSGKWMGGEKRCDWEEKNFPLTPILANLLGHIRRRGGPGGEQVIHTQKPTAAICSW